MHQNCDWGEDGNEPLWEDFEPHLDALLEPEYLQKEVQCPHCYKTFNTDSFPKKFKYSFAGRLYTFYHHGDILIPEKDAHSCMIPYSVVDPTMEKVIDDMFDKDIPCTD